MKTDCVFNMCISLQNRFNWKYNGRATDDVCILKLYNRLIRIL